MATLVGLFLLTLPVRTVLSAEGFTPRCGDCWCVPEDGSSCPDFQPGIYQSFPAQWESLYSSYQLTSDVLNLVGEDGGINTCYPFSGAVNISLVAYPEAQGASPCVVPSAPDSAVCGYVVADNSSSCLGSSYELKTFDTIEELNSTAGASLVHSGQCGVCSNAGDLAVRMKTIDTLKSQAITCGYQYVFDSDFDKLTLCFSQIGLSAPCAILNAHGTATNFYLCGKKGLCFPDQTTNELPMNDFSQPGCPFNACYNCSVSFGEVFDKLSGLGRNAFNAGFNDAVAVPCSNFTRVSRTGACFELSPTVAPAPTSKPLAPSPTPPTAPTSGSPRQWCHRSLLPWMAAVFLVLQRQS